jgi:hypothetical protein
MESNFIGEQTGSCDDQFSLLHSRAAARSHAGVKSRDLMGPRIRPERSESRRGEFKHILRKSVWFRVQIPARRKDGGRLGLRAQRKRSPTNLRRDGMSATHQRKRVRSTGMIRSRGDASPSSRARCRQKQPSNRTLIVSAAITRASLFRPAIDAKLGLT